MVILLLGVVVVEADMAAAQSLWANLNERIVNDPLVLVLLVLLAVLFAVVLGVSLGSRPVKRVLRTIKPSKEPIEPEIQPETTLSEPPPLGFADLQNLLETYPYEAIQELRGMGHLKEDKDQAQLRWQQQVLTAYVGAPVLDKLRAADDVDVAAGAIELAQTVSGAILFFDLRGFTIATEHLGGAYVMRLLNVYLRQMAQVVSEAGGVVDKFIGDNVMATFGVLKGLDNPSQSACDCAQSMIENMEHINEQLAERGLPSLRPSVGLSFGEVVSGTLGGSKRRSFTVIGAAVNRAARLESHTRELGVDLLMDHRSYELLDDPPWGMKVHHRVELRGVEEPIMAWSWTKPRITPPSS